MPKNSPDESKPNPKTNSRVPVQVQCEGYRCMAYRDDNGTWIDFHSGKPMEGKVQMVPHGETD